MYFKSRFIVVISNFMEKEDFVKLCLPSSFQAPSIWYAAVEAPNINSFGNVLAIEFAQETTKKTNKAAEFINLISLGMIVIRENT